MKKDSYKSMLIVGILVLLLPIIAGCSDNEEPMPPTPKAVNSLIYAFQEPEHISYFHEFSFDYIYEPCERYPGYQIIAGGLLHSFNLRTVGGITNYASAPVRFNELLHSYKDVDIKEEQLPMDAYNYLPLSKAVSSIKIYTNRNQHGVNKGSDCSEFFDISYVSFADYIGNGYNWEGVENRGPNYRMSLKDFNEHGVKDLIDANTLTFHLSKSISELPESTIIDLSTGFMAFSYRVVMEFTDGSSVEKIFSIASDSDYSLEIYNYMLWYNKNPQPMW